MKTNIFIKYVGISLFIVILSIYGCNNAELNDKATSPVSIELNMLQTPKLNEIVDIEINVKTDVRAKDMVVELRLPKGFEYVSGDFRIENEKIIWNQEIKAKQSKTIHAKLKSIESGDNWEILAMARTSVPGGSFGDADALLVSFDKTSGRIRND